MDVGQQQVIERVAPGLEPGAVRLLDGRRASPDHHEIAAPADGSRPDEGDRRLLEQRVDRVDPGADVAELDERERGGFLHHVIRKWSTITQRRRRENERGPVIPSPVGLAMVKEV